MILESGVSCAQLVPAARSGVLVDGRDFYRAVYAACSRAERSIVMLGWQFESKVALLRGHDADGCEHPCELVGFLRDLCEARPELEVHILAWDASAVFTFEREPLQRLMFRALGHRRIHYKMDNAHPVGASHHQKLVAIDRSIAFVGGLDVCNSRWDDRRHAAVNADRCSHKEPYGPFHDVQAYVTGDAVDTLRGWFEDRWHAATGDGFPARDLPRRELPIEATLEVTAPTVGLARTVPARGDTPAIKELYQAHLRAIAAAERVIYIENQYVSSDELGSALEDRMRSARSPLEIIFVLPEKSSGPKERISIGIYQQRIFERLTATAAATGHHLGVYSCASPGPDGDVPIFIHAKVLAVDDRFLLVSSANLTNRSMGFDTELGLAWETAAPEPSLRAARIDLLGEHCGLAGAEAEALLGSPEGLVARLDDLARRTSHPLRLHRRNRDEKPGKWLALFVPDETPFDPDGPQMIEGLLPEPRGWLDRIFRDPLQIARGAVRTAARRVRG
ncbi:MAG: phospholipase D-like domain-containing protein [Kofleriaceae bacterium]